MREAIEAAWARLLYLPPYSPDFNPCMDGSCGSSAYSDEAGRGFRFEAGRHSEAKPATGPI